VIPNCSIIFRWSCAVVQFVDAGVVLDPGAESVRPGRLPHEITNVSPATKLTEERIGDRVRLCMVMKLVNEINQEVTGLPARRNLKTGCLQFRKLLRLGSE